MAAALMIEAGAHIEAIKQRLGHSSIRVTSNVYGNLLPTFDESVTAALDARFTRLRPSGDQSAGSRRHRPSR